MLKAYATSRCVVKPRFRAPTTGFAVFPFGESSPTLSW